MPRPSRWPEILVAAGEEFRDHGYENATLEGIAARVGIFKGSIYNYVASKEELLLAVVEGPATALLAELDRLRSDPGVGVGTRNIGHLEQSSRFAMFREMDRRYMADVEALLAEGAATGEFSLAAEPRIVARAIVGMIDWMQHWFVPRGAEEDLRLADQMVALALGGLAAGGSMRAMIGALPGTTPAPLGVDATP